MSGDSGAAARAGAHRSAPVQQGPPPDLSGFPATWVDPGQLWFREHKKRDGDDAGCWYFNGYARGAQPQGRFDLVAPNGTCYLAETPGAAARERCGRFLAAGAPIPPGHYAGRVISTVQAPAGARRIADSTHEDAARHHQVTRELFAGSDYALSAAWAHALHMTGFDALLYEPRFGPGPGRGVALFGRAGADPGRAVVSTEDLSVTLRGMGVLPRIPSLAEADPE